MILNSRSALRIVLSPLRELDATDTTVSVASGYSLSDRKGRSAGDDGGRRPALARYFADRRLDGRLQHGRFAYPPDRGGCVDGALLARHFRRHLHQLLYR